MAEKSDWEHNIMPGNLPGAEFLEKKKRLIIEIYRKICQQNSMCRCGAYIKPIFSHFFLSLLGNDLFE